MTILRFTITRPVLAYGLVTLAILGPMLLPGYILTLDMTFTPELRAPTKIDNTYFLRWLFHILDFLLSADLIQKSVLLFVLVMSGWGMHRLVGWLSTTGLRIETWAIYAAGLLYIINPFIYTRFMVGHYLVLLGYALLPFFVLSLLKFVQAPGYRSAVALGLWAAACTSVNIHIIFLLLFIAVVLGGAHLTANPTLRFRRFALTLGVSIAVWLTLCGFWFIPSVLGLGSTSEYVASFDERHILAFTTKADPQYGLGFNVAGLHGFWADVDLRYLLPKAFTPLWPLLTVFILLLSITGAVVGIRKRQPAIIGLAIIGLIGWLLSMGTHGVGGLLYRWMLDVVPLFGGYREPQKFMVLLVLAYCVLLAVGASYLYRRIRSNAVHSMLLVAALALPFIYTPTMFWSFSGQLRPVEYPADWYSLNRKLQEDTGDYKVLFLPWHMYLTFDFHDRVIANPASRFFDVPVIQGDNAEIGNLDTEGSTADTRFVRDRLIDRADTIRDAGKILAQRDIKYIIVAKNDELAEYDYLKKQRDLRLVQDSPHLLVYLNTAYRE